MQQPQEAQQVVGTGLRLGAGAALQHAASTAMGEGAWNDMGCMGLALCADTSCARVPIVTPRVSLSPSTPLHPVSFSVSLPVAVPAVWLLHEAWAGCGSAEMSHVPFNIFLLFIK